MSAREFLYIVQESAVNTPVASPTVGTNAIYIRLIDGNSFGMVAQPVIEEIPYGGGFAVTAEAISDHYECKGQLKTKLYPICQRLVIWRLIPSSSAARSGASRCSVKSSSNFHIRECFSRIVLRAASVG